VATLRYGSHGEAVKTLQRRLNGNRFHSFNLSIDGQFGPHTSAAVHECKWFMGYPSGSCQPVAGAVFNDLITGKVALTPKQRTRRAERLAVPPWEKKRHAALARARADIGLHEHTHNNIKYNEWWCGGHNDGEPYCVRALSYWWAPECTAVVRGSRWQGTDALLEDAKAGRFGVRLVADPQPGDIGVIDFDGHSNPDHGLMVEGIGGGYVNSIEANATDPQGREGVDRHSRPIRNCWFIRITK
jgi:hypothetical protein